MEARADDNRPKPVRRESQAKRQLDNPNPEARRRLLEAAQSIVEEHGEPGVRVNDVAKAAGLSVGTFYLYFDGKADLLVQLVQERTDLLRRRMGEAARGATSATERLDRALVAYFDFVEESPGAFLHFLAAGSLETTAGRLASWAVEQHAADLVPVLEEAMRAGTVRRYEDATLLAQAITGLAQHLAGFWLEHRETYDRDEILGLIRQFTALGLSP